MADPAPATGPVLPEPASPRVGLESRCAAWRAIRTVHERKAWSPPAVGAALRATTLSGQDRAFAANLAYSTLRWEGTLDWALAQVVKRPLADIEPAVLDVLRIGAWQLLYGNVPDRAAVDTAVEVARSEVGDRVTGFVNGVLRGLGRKATRLPWPSGDEGVALRLAYPTWMVAEARRRFGARAEDVLEAGNVSPGLTLRATGDRDRLVSELQAAGLDAQPGQRASEAVRVAGGDPNTMAAVAAGRATPQDEASMLVARVVADAGGTGHQVRAPGWSVLDLCAAPGGKSTHLAQLGAAVVAADLRPTRAGLVAAAATRLGVADRVAVVVADATAPPWHPERFDAVLVDAPCTGLGVVRRRPELRWRREADDPVRLGRLQLQLLESASNLVAPGGRLVYSVCTWPVAETIAVADAFLAAHGDRFVAVDVAGIIDADPVGSEPGVQLTPDVDAVDGMYIAAFDRT